MQDGNPREPIFNVPGVVLAILAVLTAVHLGRSLLGEATEEWLLWSLAFVPARLDGASSDVPGPAWAGATSLVTYSLLHGNFMHLGVNAAWLLAVGTPIARRMTVGRFIVFFGVCAIGGALLFALANPGLDRPLVGASGAISGLMAAVFRLMFGVRDAEDWRVLREQALDAPRLSLRQMLANRSAMTAIGAWVGINLLAGLIGLGGVDAGGAIAWEAHLGGFIAGLLLFGVFDRGRGSVG